MSESEIPENLREYLKCQMYPFDLPIPGDLVLITFRKIEPEIGVKVSLDEYDGKEGTIYWSQLTRKRKIKSYNKVCPIGRTAVVEVLDVSDDGFINLSKRSITEGDEAKCQANYDNSRRIHSILKRLAVRHKIPLEELCRATTWPLYEQLRARIVEIGDSKEDQDDEEETTESKSDTISDVDEKHSKESESEDESVYHPLNIISDRDRFLGLNLSSEIQKIFLDDYDELFGVENFNLTSEIRLISYQIEGLQDIKRELKALYKLAEPYKNDGIQFQVILDESPKYVLKITGPDKDKIQDLCGKCYESLEVFKKLGLITRGKEKLISQRIT